jgi:hypothetical protein
MKVYETVTIPARQEKQTKYRQCDLCGNKSIHMRHNNNWSGDESNVQETKISYTTGYRYSDSADLEVDTIDICPECFTKKLIPWIEAQGGKFYNEDISW